MNTNRTIVIGDIHGGFKALKQLLSRVELRPTDQLIFLGDYVDGWSEGFEVIQFLIELKALREQNKQVVPVYLKGNHDDLFLAYLKTGKGEEMWHRHGGDSTIRSYSGRSAISLESHLNFLENDLVNYYESRERGYFHAGFQNLNGPSYEHFPEMTYWDRTLWEMALATDSNLTPDHPFYPSRLKIYQEIFIGHTPTTRLDSTRPVRAMNVWNVDTGAAFKGPLSALCVKTKEVWQSDPVYTLYRDERGRN
ncbi:MAG: metallophosphoesterase [Nonlabens sp.]